jgi:4-aminobutyrate aminotransferase
MRFGGRLEGKRMNNEFDHKAIRRDSQAICKALKVRFYPIVVDSAKRSIVRDTLGREFIDFAAGWAVANVGYSHPKVVNAIVKQVQKTTFSSVATFPSEVCVEYAERLTKITPGNFTKKAWFGLAGSDANDLIFKLLPIATKRPKILSFVGSYHGQTMGSLSLSGHKAHSKYTGFGNVVKVPYAYCYRCPFGLTYPDCGAYCAKEFIEDYIFETLIDPDDLSGLIVEAIQSDGGDVVPPDEYMGLLKKLCDDYGLLFVDDEVKIGFGRTGRMFGIEHSSVIPDLMVMGKPMAGGMPLSAVVGRAEVLDSIFGTHVLTTGGHVVSCAAGIATLDAIRDDKLLENAHKVGEFMKRRFKEMAESHGLVGDVRGKGMIIGVELVKDRKTKQPARTETEKLCYQAWKYGLLTVYVGIHSNVMEITPPLVLTEAEAAKGLGLFERALEDVEKGRVSDSEVAQYTGW